MTCLNCKPNFTNDEGAWAGVELCPYHALMDEMVAALDELIAGEFVQTQCYGPLEKLLAKARAAKAGEI